MLLVDTNVLVDVLEDDPEWADGSIGQLRAQSKIQRLAINPLIGHIQRQLNVRYLRRFAIQLRSKSLQ